jgi:hypothetical protein
VCTADEDAAVHGKVNKPGGDLMTSADLQPPTAEETSPGIGWAILRELVRSPTVAFGALAIHPFWIPSLLVCVLLLGAGQGVQYQESLRFGREVQESALQRFDLPEEDVEAAMAALPDPENLTAADYAKGVGQGVLSTLVFGFLGAVLLHLGVKVAGGDPAFGGSLALFFLAWTVSCVGVLAHGLLASLSGTLEPGPDSGRGLPLVDGDLPGLVRCILPSESLVPPAWSDGGARTLSRDSKVGLRVVLGFQGASRVLVSRRDRLDAGNPLGDGIHGTSVLSCP